MAKEINVFEMEYSVSPGGIDCWEVNVPGYGCSENYSDFKSAGEAVEFVLDKYPAEELQLNIISLQAYERLTEQYG
jgi:hypothetical protein